MKRCYIGLGAYGDICNILPILFKDDLDGHEVSLCVAKEYEPILDGIKYAKRFVYPGHYSEAQKAFKYALASENFDEVIPFQCYGWNFQPQTDSFCKDAYQIASRLSEFRKYPLIFDNRNLNREKELSMILESKPIILVSIHGRSSPFPPARHIASALVRQYPDHQIVNLCDVKAEKFYDLLGLFDRAKVLVSIDTGHLHLARASKVPVIALVTHLPSMWHGAVPPENTILAQRYNRVSVPDIFKAIEKL